MHESMDRLFALARSGLRRPPIDESRPNASVARALNVSPQTVQNWIDRGVSKEGAINAADVFGGSASYISEGQGDSEAARDAGATCPAPDRSPDLTSKAGLCAGLLLSLAPPRV